MVKPKKRVLVVDDDPEFVQTVQVALELQGHEVLTANDGEKGLDIAAVEQPDLMILDLMMPKRDGFGVLRDLRTREQGDSLRVIVVTANEEREHETYAEVLGANEFFRKPFAMDILLKCIEKHLK